MLYKYFIFIFFLIFTLKSQAKQKENKIDSLMEVGKNLIDQKPDSARKIFESIIIDLKNKNNYYTKQSINIINEILRINFEINNLDAVDTILTELYKVAVKTKDTTNIIFYYYQKAHYLNKIGLQKNAITPLTKALNFMVKNNINNDELFRIIYSGISTIYSSLHNYKQAKIYRKKSIELAKKTNANDLFGDYINLGVIYLNTKNYDSSEYYFKKSYEISKSNIDGSYLSLVNLGAVYIYQKKYNKSIKYFTKSLDICKKHKFYFAFPYIYASLSECYMSLFDSTRNTSYLEKSLNYATLSKNYSKTLSDKKKSYKNLYKIFELYNNCDSSYYYYKIYIQYSDSLLKISNNKENKKKLYQMSIKIKDNEIKLKNQKLKEVKKRKQLQSRIYTIVIIFLIIFVALLMLYYLQKNKANKKLKEKNKIIRQKNKQIFEGFNYAKTLLNTINNSNKLLSQYFPSSFVIDKPKEIIGGDFLWLQNISKYEYLIALSDCTGHGIPGAFLSITGQLTLTNFVKEHNITEPDELLKNLHSSISELLVKKNNLISDGMDIIILKINTYDKTIVWSSANRTSLIFVDNEITPQIIEPEIYSIGDQLIQNNVNITFSKHKIKYTEKAYIYLFSDGITDLFGGDDGKKYSIKRFKNLLSEIKTKPASEQKDIIIKTIKDWKGSHSQTDDIIVVGILLP